MSSTATRPAHVTALIGLAAFVIMAIAAGFAPAHAAWDDRDHRGEHRVSPRSYGGAHPYHHDWTGGYYRPPAVVYGGPVYEAPPPPLVYGPTVGINLPGVSIGINP